MKAVLKKYKRQIQIAGGICLIAVLGIGGYAAANQNTDVQTKIETKQKAKSSDQKIAKKDTKDVAAEKKTDMKKDTVKKEDTKSEKTAKKSENSENKKSAEKPDKKESVKAEKETGKTESSSKSEQKLSQPESKPEQKISKPEKPQHTHIWQEVNHTINHEEVGHNEQYVIKEAWTETVTEEVQDPWECCNVCGADCTADPSGHMKQHALAGEGGGRHTEYYKTVTKMIEHPAEYGTRWVIDQPAWTETISDGFFCTGCGAKK